MAFAAWRTDWANAPPAWSGQKSGSSIEHGIHGCGIIVGRAVVLVVCIFFCVGLLTVRYRLLLLVVRGRVLCLVKQKNQLLIVLPFLSFDFLLSRVACLLRFVRWREQAYNDVMSCLKGNQSFTFYGTT